jgi:hypothetical protein
MSEVNISDGGVKQVNKSTNINKANNHLTPQSLNIKKNPQHMALEILFGTGTIKWQS